MKAGAYLAIAIVLATVFAFMGTSSSLDILSAGTDGDSTRTSAASGMETIGGDVTLIRGCSAGEGLTWNESTDVWECGAVGASASILTSGSDGDSSVTASDSGLETIGGLITIIRGCANTQVIAWNETSDQWECAADAGSTIASATDTNISTPAGGNLLIYDGSDSWDNKAMSGDATITAGGVIDVTSSDAASALAADPANCSAGEVAGGITAAGVAESCLDPITETELDTEAELETQLSDVTNVFTNNDTIDISTYTNLAVSAPIVLTDDTLSLNQNGGTDVTADLEEETHASEHASGGNDVLYTYPVIVWVYQGNVSAETHASIINLPWDVTYIEAHCVAGTAPTTDAIIVQFQEAGSDIFADGDRVSIAATTTEDTSGSPTDTTGTAGQNLTMIIEQADTGDTGADLTCYLKVKIPLSAS